MFLVIGRLPSGQTLVDFDTLEEALLYIYHNDPLGTLRVRFPDGRWFHPDTNTYYG